MRPWRRTRSPSAKTASSKRVDDAARAAASVRSANSAKPAIASTSSSRLGHDALLVGSHVHVSHAGNGAPARLTTRRRGGAAWRRSAHGGPDDAHPRPPSGAAGGAPGCSTASTPTGWNGSPRSGGRGRLPGGPRHRPPGRDRDGVLRHRRRARSGSSATARRSRASGPGDFFGELSVLDGRPRIAQVVADEPTTLPRPRVLGLRGGPARAADASPWRSCAGWPAACATLTEADRH